MTEAEYLLNREWQELQRADHVALVKQCESLTARLTVLAGEAKSLRAALEQIRDYKPMPIEGDHFSFAQMQRIARAALGAERA